jgi:hypothetical protein
VADDVLAVDGDVESPRQVGGELAEDRYMGPENDLGLPM